MSPRAPFPSSELLIVRRLAERVATLAHEPRMARIRSRWAAVNEGRRPDRAPVWCRPVGCWDELLPPETLACQHPRLRALERHFRQILIKAEIGDDTYVPPWFEVPRLFEADPPNRWGVDIRHVRPGDQGGAWTYDPPLKSPEDLLRLQTPRFTYRRTDTEQVLEETAQILDGLLPVRPVTGSPFGLLLSATIGTVIADLMGLTEMMVAMAENPDFVHAVTRRVADAVIASHQWLETEDLLDQNDQHEMTLSEPFGPPPRPDGSHALANLWCAANSQEYDQVSPAMWREFCFDYQRRIMAPFGRVLYGCCENLTLKMDDVLALPNLRVFVCSAWTDLDRLLEKAPPSLTLMWRQKASDVVFPDSLRPIRETLELGTQKLRGRPYQIVLRELQTLAGHPRRLHEWTHLAIEAAERNG